MHSHYERELDSIEQAYSSGRISSKERKLQIDALDEAEREQAEREAQDAYDSVMDNYYMRW